VTQEVQRAWAQHLQEAEAFRANLVQTCDLLARQVDELEGQLERLGRAVQGELARLAPYVPERDGPLSEEAGSEGMGSAEGDGDAPSR
jgi:hypothetical protein